MFIVGLDAAEVHKYVAALMSILSLRSAQTAVCGDRERDCSCSCLSIP